MPADISFTLDPGQGITGIRIYRDLKFGKLMHLVMTDQRLYRADHLIPEAAPSPLTGQPLGSIGARYMVPQATLASVEAAKLRPAPPATRWPWSACWARPSASGGSPP
jgi:alkaline phosphatase D